MKHFLKMKKVISALAVMLILCLTTCANAAGTGQSSAGTDGTESADTEARSDFNKNSSQDSEELTNIRVTFDIEKMKDGLLERYEQLYSSEKTVNVLKAISKAKNEDAYLDFNKKIVHGGGHGRSVFLRGGVFRRLALPEHKPCQLPSTA